MHALHRFALCLLMGTFLVGASASADQILLDEDFNDGVADGFTLTSPAWGVEDGVLRCSLEGVEVWGHAFYDAAFWTDYIYEVDLKVEGSINHLIRFRIQDPENCYEVNVRGGFYNDAFLQKYVGGVMTQLAEVEDVFIGAGVPSFRLISLPWGRAGLRMPAPTPAGSSRPRSGSPPDPARAGTG